MAAQLKKSQVAAFSYNDLTPQISWGKQFVTWSKIDKSEDPEMLAFAKQLGSTLIKQRAIELVRTHTVPD